LLGSGYDQSTCSFQDIFAEPGKWFHRPGRPFRRRPGTKQLHGIESAMMAIPVLFGARRLPLSHFSGN